MLMLSVVAPMLSCVCCCLLVSVLSSCVLYAPMHSCICSGSSCVLYVCLLSACLCFHVFAVCLLVLVLYACLYLHHPCAFMCLYVCLLSACLCFHVFVCMLAVCLLVLVLYVCLYLRHPPCTSDSNTIVATVVRAIIAMYLGLCQKTQSKSKNSWCAQLFTHQKSSTVCA